MTSGRRGHDAGADEGAPLPAGRAFRAADTAKAGPRKGSMCPGRPCRNRTEPNRVYRFGAGTGESRLQVDRRAGLKQTPGWPGPSPGEALAACRPGKGARNAGPAGAPAGYRFCKG